MSESNSQIPRLRHPLYKGGINSHLILSYGTYFMIINGITSVSLAGSQGTKFRDSVDVCHVECLA
jgi:hypothetical protein